MFDYDHRSEDGFMLWILWVWSHGRLRLPCFRSAFLFASLLSGVHSLNEGSAGKPEPEIIPAVESKSLEGIRPIRWCDELWHPNECRHAYCFTLVEIQIGFHIELCLQRSLRPEYGAFALKLIKSKVVYDYVISSSLLLDCAHISHHISIIALSYSQVTLALGAVLLTVGLVVMTVGYAIPTRIEAFGEGELLFVDRQAMRYNRSLHVCVLVGTGLLTLGGVLMAGGILMSSMSTPPTPTKQDDSSPQSSRGESKMGCRILSAMKSPADPVTKPPSPALSDGGISPLARDDKVQKSL